MLALQIQVIEVGYHYLHVIIAGRILSYREIITVQIVVLRSIGLIIIVLIFLLKMILKN